VYCEKRDDSRNAAATRVSGGFEDEIPCQPERMPPMETAIPSADRRIVQNPDFGFGDGERHWRTVWRDLGDVVIASNVYT
jgi:hypothetical protein